MKRTYRTLVATFVAVFAAIGMSQTVKSENLQSLPLGNPTIIDDLPLLAQAATAKKAAAKPKVNVDKSGVILKGYDPVAYFEENRPVKGDPKFSSTYRTAA